MLSNWSVKLSVFFTNPLLTALGFFWLRNFDLLLVLNHIATQELWIRFFFQMWSSLGLRVLYCHNLSLIPSLMWVVLWWLVVEENLQYKKQWSACIFGWWSGWWSLAKSLKGTNQNNGNQNTYGLDQHSWAFQQNLKTEKWIVTSHCAHEQLTLICFAVKNCYKDFLFCLQSEKLRIYTQQTFPIILQNDKDLVNNREVQTNSVRAPKLNPQLTSQSECLFT